MTAFQALDLQFPQAKLSLWREAAEAALKGADFEKKLYTQTLEGLQIQPLYCAQDLAERWPLPHSPQQGDGRRGRGAGWQIQQQYRPGPELSSQLQADFAQGLEAWTLDASSLSSETIGQLVEQSPGPAWISHSHPAGLLSALSEQPHLAGLYCDPLGLFATGQIKDPKGAWDEVAQCMQALPKTIHLECSGLPYHEAGAHAVQELSAVLANAVESVEYLKTKHGIEASQSLGQARVTLATGPQFFMQLAKFRAAHLLLKRLAAIYDSTDYPQIHAQSARIDLSHYDIHVNYLRQSVGALAAVLGNCDSLCTDPYDVISATPSAAGRRQARNLQLLLKHEVHLDQIADPGGGAYFIEVLTEELAQASWAAFQQIEAQGGLQAVLQSGQLQEDIAQVAAQRLEQVHKRKRILVGANLYANAQENLAEAELGSPEWGETPKEATSDSEANASMPLLHPIRLASDYEQLRQRVEKSPLQVLLLNLESARGSRPRQDFAQGVFEVMGAQVESSEILESFDQAVSCAQESTAEILVLCGSDETYEQWLEHIVPRIQAAQQSCLVLAGKARSAYQALGITEYVYMGANIYQILSKLEQKCR